MKINYRTDLVVDPIFETAGEPGRDGVDGINGADGRDGVDGARGLDGRAWVFRGDYSSARQYAAGDVVASDGSSYLCTRDNQHREPPNGRFWAVIAAKGERGEDGRDGFGSKGVKGDSGELPDTSATADSQMTIGDVIYSSGNGHVDLAEAGPDVTSMKARAFGMVTSVKGSTIKYRTTGVVENPNWSLTPQTVYYLSPTVPGGLTSTYPTASGQFVVIVGVATSPTQLAVNIHWMLEQS